VVLSPLFLLLVVSSFKLFPYQSEALRSVWVCVRRARERQASGESGPIRAVCVQPTGAGKTVEIFCLVREVVKRFGWRCLVIEPTRELAQQVTDALALLYNKKIFTDAGIAGAPKTWAEVKTAAQTIKTKTGKDGLFINAGGYFLLVNNKLVPPEMGPRSYKDLEDPKYKGLIVLSEPIGPSPGSRWAAYAWRAYGDEHLKKVIANVKALTRAEIDAPKQIARGEYGIFIHPTQVGAADIWKLPKPHPFRLVVPEDGVMLLTGGINLLQGAPHANAARVFMNFLMTKPAQQIFADDAGGPFIRKDVKPAIPELAHFVTAKPFPNNPDTYEFGSKLFFEWSAKAEPHLKAAGLK